MGETFPENEKQTHFRELSLTPRPPLPKVKSRRIFGSCPSPPDPLSRK
jgi:hypothetical protein